MDLTLSLRYEAAERHIAVLHGEVVPSVHRDLSRPFVVESNGGSRRALGTEFLIAAEVLSLHTCVTPPECPGTGVGRPISLSR